MSLIFWYCWPLPPFATHFTKYAYWVTSPFGRSPLPQSEWHHLLPAIDKVILLLFFIDVTDHMDDSWSPLVLPILEAQCEASLHRHPERMYRYVFFFNLKKKKIFFWYTLQKFNVDPWWNVPTKSFKICHIFWNTKKTTWVFVIAEV